MTAMTIMTKPIAYMLESVVIPSHPFPMMEKTKPTKRSKGRKVFGLDKFSGIAFQPYVAQK